MGSQRVTTNIIVVVVPTTSEYEYNANQQCGSQGHVTPHGLYAILVLLAACCTAVQRQHVLLLVGWWCCVRLKACLQKQTRDHRPRTTIHTPPHTIMHVAVGHNRLHQKGNIDKADERALQIV